MDAILHKSEAYGLKMKDIKMFSDGSGGVCDLVVTSMPFTGSFRFFFDYPSLPEFTENLEAIKRNLRGEATLGQQFEESYVRFYGNGLGHITVSGLLAEHKEQTQKLQFSFVTDQTALGPFINDLNEAAKT